jgi:hypothetical protein
MKIRALLFLLTFLLGIAAGYLAAQEKTKKEAKRLFTEAAVRVEGWVDSAVGKLPQASAKARAKQPSTASANPERAAETPQSKIEYIRQFVGITELQAKSDVTKAGSTISGQLRNSGDRAIRRLEITAYFMGKEGIIFEARCAVLEKPLPANSSMEFRFKVENVPPDWIEGKVRASITEIAFQE